jgi:hypothetical protein
LLEAFGEELWIAEGPTVSFYGFAYPTRMAVARLPDRRLWLWFTAELGAEAPARWQGMIDHVVVSGSFAMDEVVFFHRASKSALVCDLIQKLDPSAFSGWRRWAMKLDGLVGPDGSTPREWRATFTNRKAARAALDTILGWNPEQLVLAHGPVFEENARDIIASSLGWMR